MTDDRLIFTVSQLNAETSRFLKQSFSQLWVEGEVSNLARPSSGHIYFTLKDSSAQLRCAMFRSRYRTPSNTQIENGQKVIVFGNVGLYEPRGDYQFIASSIEDAGAGKLQQQFEALKQKLSAKGLFAQEHKQTLPRFIQNLAIITSPTGAAIQDVLNVLKRRSPHIEVNIYPVTVQGKEAASQIAQAIEQANRNTHDAILLARGGGSIEDLWSFNEEIVGRAIFTSKLPLVTGVGHEIDFTIADFVADQRAPTPSAAAELLSIDSQQLHNTLTAVQTRLQQTLLRQLQQANHQLNQLQQRLSQQHPHTQLEQKAQRLDELETRLHQAINKKLASTKQQLNFVQQRFAQQSPHQQLKQQQQKLVQLEKYLYHHIEQHIQHKQQQLKTQVAQLQALSPLATLERGYSLSYKKKKLLTQTKQVKVGQTIQVKLNDGELSCEVQAIQTSSVLG